MPEHHAFIASKCHGLHSLCLWTPSQDGIKRPPPHLRDAAKEDVFNIMCAPAHCSQRGIWGFSMSRPQARQPTSTLLLFFLGSLAASCSQASHSHSLAKWLDVLDVGSKEDLGAASDAGSTREDVPSAETQHKRLVSASSARKLSK